jgi:type II secretory ATPase GspE/PulE/Tfp pilus assembly ATPase PilB-like protein
MRDRISCQPAIVELRSMAKDAGMVSLRADGMAKVKAGITTVEEVLRATAT